MGNHVLAYNHILIGVFINLSHPFTDFSKWISISDIISNNNTMSTFIVTRSDCFKAFLSSSIPNLKFYSFAINFNGTNFKIYSNSWHEIIMKYVILNSIILEILYLQRIWVKEMIYQLQSFQWEEPWKGSRWKNYE